MKRAFTLIELLVVIAIIAILAAILFPVFAQAKMAAKKTSDLSNIKQLATGMIVYTTDHDDQFPMAGGYRGGYEYPEAPSDTPADWDSTVSAAYHHGLQTAWSNSTMPYIKNLDIFRSPVGKEFRIPGWDYTTPPRKPLANVTYNFNGLLATYPASSVNRPSQLRLLTEALGDLTAKGAAFASPYLYCYQSGPCRYVPSSATCNGYARNGEWSETQWQYGTGGGFTKRLFSGGTNAVMTDTSAKFFRASSSNGTRTDYRTDPFSNYAANGWTTTEWQDTEFCHSLLFKPDFDFENFGTPNEY